MWSTNPRLIFAALAALCLTEITASEAQTQILGSSLGKACFDAVLSNTSSAHLQERVCDDALDDLTLSQRDLSATYVNRGIARSRKNNIEGALQDYQRAKEITPNRGAIYLNEGIALIRIGSYWDAVDQLNTSLRLGANDIHLIYYHLGIAWENLGDIPEAYANFKLAAEAKPDWDLARQQLSRFSVLEH